MASEEIAVTGATGGLGGRVARLLAQHGIAHRLLVREPSRAPDLPHARVMQFGGYDDAPGVRRALDGARTLFLVSAAEDPDRVALHRSAVDAAVDAGIERIVYTSFVGAAPDATFTFARDHFHTEEHIKSRDVAHTFLRHNLYIDFVPMLCSADGVTRRQITFQNESLEEAWESRRPSGAREYEIEGWITTYTAIAAGDLAEATDTVERFLDREPRRLGDWLRDNPESWRHLVHTS